MHVILLKKLLLEAMTVDDAEAVFLQHGIPQAAEMPKEELKSVWRKLLIQNHPDKGGSNEDVWELTAAYDALKNATVPMTADGQFDTTFNTTFDPSKSKYHGRTMPKDPKTKGALKTVGVQFRFEHNDEVLANGLYDVYGLTQITKALEKKLGVEISYDPLVPFDEKTMQWLAETIVVYVNVAKKEPQAIKLVQKTVAELNQRYSEKPA